MSAEQHAAMARQRLRLHRHQRRRDEMPRRVLVVDDDFSIRELIAMVLADEGYEVLTAADGAEALTLVGRRPPDLVLLDLNMPVLDGWQTQARLRVEAPRLPVVIMTAGNRARQEAEQHAAAGYLAKPFDVDDLCATVARLVA